MNDIEKRAPELLPCPFCGECTAFDESHRPDCYFRVSQQLLDDADVAGSLSEVYDAWNRRASLTPPEGYVLVPVEPTEEMLGEGAESRPMRPFTPLEEWEEFEAMTGCEQGRHKARLCYAAMLAARPEVQR